MDNGSVPQDVNLGSLFEELMKPKDTQIGGSHYKDMKIQPYEYIMANNIPYLEANVIKYVSRHRKKGREQDIKKAIHSLQLLLEKYEEYK